MVRRIGRRAWAVLGAVGVLAAVVWALMSWLGGPRPVDPSNWAQSKYDFRNKCLDSDGLDVVGARDCVLPEEKGLKVTIPLGRTDANTGVSLKKQVVGDFEITASFEVLDAPLPKTGHGVGVALFLDDGISHGASLQSVRTPGNTRVFVVHHYERSAGGEMKHASKTYPTTSESGSLRVTRRGSTLTYWVAEGDSRDFRELESVQWSTEAVKILQMYAQVGGATNAVTARFPEWDVRAESLLEPNLVVTSSRRDPVTWLVVLLFLTLPFGAGWLLWTRQKGHTDPEL
jgi:hypothetical protein